MRDLIVRMVRSSSVCGSLTHPTLVSSVHQYLAQQLFQRFCILFRNALTPGIRPLCPVSRFLPLRRPDPRLLTPSEEEVPSRAAPKHVVQTLVRGVPRARAEFEV